MSVTIDQSACEVVIDACDSELVLDASTAVVAVEAQSHELVIDRPSPGPPGDPTELLALLDPGDLVALAESQEPE